MIEPTLTLVTRSNKAVAVGAVSYYLDNFVTGRISKFTYGASCDVHYQPSNLEHVRRGHKSYLNAAGDKLIPDYFQTMLLRVRHLPLLLVLQYNLIPSQGTKVLEDRELRTTLCYVTDGAPQRQASQPVLRYTGTSDTPEWRDTEPGSVFSFNNFARGTQVRQPNTGYCAIYRQISLQLRTRRHTEEQAGCATRESST